MKRCPNNHDNPDNAKFCRICGYNFDKSFNSQLRYYWNSFSLCMSGFKTKIINQIKGLFENPSVFTPDMFPNIRLSPSSVEKVTFNCQKGVPFIIASILLFLLLTYFKHEVYSLLDSLSVPYTISFYIVTSAIWLVCILFIIFFIPFLRRVWKFIAYKTCADYIESYAFVKSLYRIAKNGKLGLFDKNTNSVILGSRYTYIDKFDQDHILVEINEKKGLFSMKKRGMIVPIRFDRIDPFKNSIAKCTKGSDLFYYDVNGNKMK